MRWNKVLGGALIASPFVAITTESFIVYGPIVTVSALAAITVIVSAILLGCHLWYRE